MSFLNRRTLTHSVVRRSSVPESPCSVGTLSRRTDDCNKRERKQRRSVTFLVSHPSLLNESAIVIEVRS